MSSFEADAIDWIEVLDPPLTTTAHNANILPVPPPLQEPQLIETIMPPPPPPTRDPSVVAAAAAAIRSNRIDAPTMTSTMFLQTHLSRIHYPKKEPRDPCQVVTVLNR